MIGRDPHCDIVVGGAHVSRRHAEFSIRNNVLWVKDLGSSNGSFVNGKRYEESALQNGDEVKFDAMIFKVVGPTEPVVHSDFEEEAERTQFRPVVNIPPKPAPAPKPQASVPAPIAPEPTNAPSQAGAGDKGGNMGVIVIVILMLMILIAVYVLA